MTQIKEILPLKKDLLLLMGLVLSLNSEINSFSVAIIPYTYKHTNFHTLKVDDIVNLEFDMIESISKKSNYFYNS